MSTDAPTGPTKDDLLTQIDADLAAANAAKDTAAVTVLTERRKAVAKPKTDTAAQRAYARHVADQVVLEGPPRGDLEDA